jgi:hypothetical protein
VTPYTERRWLACLCCYNPPAAGRTSPPCLVLDMVITWPACAVHDGDLHRRPSLHTGSLQVSRRSCPPRHGSTRKFDEAWHTSQPKHFPRFRPPRITPKHPLLPLCSSSSVSGCNAGGVILGAVLSIGRANSALVTLVAALLSTHQS